MASFAAGHLAQLAFLAGMPALGWAIIGTDAAREAADMVIADDNFATIVGAIEAGRGVYQNIRKFLSYVMVSNVAEMAEADLPAVLAMERDLFDEPVSLVTMLLRVYGFLAGCGR